MKTPTEAEMLHRMAAYCSTAERCAQDVRKKIETAGLPSEAAQRIIAQLEEGGFLDEQRFAHSFVSDKLRFNQWGRVKISYELGKRQISPGLRREALEEIDEATYRSTLLSLLKAKKKTLRGKDEREDFAKLLRFAAGRGFESGESIACLRQLYQGNDYGNDLE